MCTQHTQNVLDELIETYWNVNYRNRTVIRESILELIETYWNVNKLQMRIVCQTACELIETYWNVNKGKRKESKFEAQN